MKVILCLDDNNGMLFNKRRQSRDRVVTEDVFSDLNGKKLKISPFSEKLFGEFYQSLCVDDDFLNAADEDDVCFVEDRELKAFNNITEITVYKWNRVYPADFKCDVDFTSFDLVEEREFQGFSHEKITKQIFRKKI